MNLDLREKVVRALMQADLDSFVDPLTRPGFIIVDEVSGMHNLNYIEKKFRKPARQGVVIYPCLYGDFKTMLNAAESYITALAEQEIFADLLVVNEAIYTVFVFVPEDQAAARVNSSLTIALEIGV